MILQILQILGGVAGLVGIVVALFLGYRSSQSSEPRFTIKLGEPDPEQDGAIIATFAVVNPGRQPIVLRSLALQRPLGAAFLAAIEETDADGTQHLRPRPTDVVSLDNEIPALGDLEIDIYVTFPPGTRAKRVQVEVEYIDQRAPTQIRSARVESLSD